MASKTSDAVCPLSQKEIEPLGDFNYPVLPNKAFAKLKSDEPQPDHKLDASYPDASILFDSEAGTLTASALGMLTFSKQGMSITPLWSLSDENMTMTMNFSPNDCFNDVIPQDAYKAGLPDGCKGVDDEALKQAMAKNSPAKGVVIAQGRAPKDGEPAQLQLNFDESNEAGAIKDNGNIDFRERGSMNTVSEGEKVAAIIPPTKGKAGFNVLGNELPAQDGQPLTIKPGTGIAFSEGSDGVITYTATSPGMLTHKDGTLSISDVVEVNSDVDMTSGNIHTEKGSIFIKGTVTTGATVSAKESVYIDNVVENATVKAGADIVINAGILMEEGGLIEATGNVTAKFMRNATIRAGGDVISEVDFVNCDIIAGGRIIAESDKGNVNGGTYVCSGMDVSEVGTDIGTQTFVTLALPEDEGAKMDTQITSIQDKLELLDKYIGTSDTKSTLLLAPKEDRDILRELFKIKKALLQKKTKLEENKQNTREDGGEELAKMVLKARKTVHAGVTITIADKSITLHKAEQFSKFHWNAEENGIAITGL